MSHIDDLIREHCPDGVHHVPMGTVLKIKNGKSHKHLTEGPVPVYGSGGIMTHVSESVACGPSVLIPRKGSLGNIYFVEGEFWNVDTIFYTEIDARVILPRYVYHLLLNLHLDELNQAGGVPSLTQSTLNALRIPVPPLPVQQEIVRILDSFVKLEAELEAELEARRIQYKHVARSLKIPRAA
jgi:type I restriction enzyme S subunit